MNYASKREILLSFVLCLLVSYGAYHFTDQTIARVQAEGNTSHQSAASQDTLSDLRGDWTTFQGNLARSGFNKYEHIINVKTAPQLSLQWTASAQGTISSQPVEAFGKIFWGSWDGLEHATNPYGKELWSVNLGQAQNTRCPPADAGVAGAASFATEIINGQQQHVVFIGGGTAHFYALNIKDGTTLWDTPLGSSPDHMLWGGSAYYNGSVYVGLASYGDCPLVQGGLVKLDAQTGASQAMFQGSPQGCLGDDIWGAPTIDVAANLIYVATGNGQCSQADPYSDALIALHASDLTVADAWQVPSSQQVNDSDFGSTPTLFQATIAGKLHKMVGLVNKNGYYYALDRTNLSVGPLWQAHISQWIKGQHAGQDSISSSAWDGTNLYIGGANTTINGSNCVGSLRAMNPATGAFVWEACLKGVVQGAAIVIPGVVVVGSGTSIIAVNATNGQVLFTYTDSNANSLFWGPPSISYGYLFEGNKDGNLYALSPGQG